MKPETASYVASVKAHPDDWEALRASNPTDYDGHTGFAELTPAQRLSWLERTAVFVSQATKSSRQVRRRSP